MRKQCVPGLSSGGGGEGPGDEASGVFAGRRALTIKWAENNFPDLVT